MVQKIFRLTILSLVESYIDNTFLISVLPTISIVNDKQLRVDITRLREMISKGKTRICIRGMENCSWQICKQRELCPQWNCWSIQNILIKEWINNLFSSLTFLLGSCNVDVYSLPFWRKGVMAPVIELAWWTHVNMHNCWVVT